MSRRLTFAFVPVVVLILGACSTSGTPQPPAPGASVGPAASSAAAVSIVAATIGPAASTAVFATGSACNLVGASDLQSIAGATSATVVADAGAGTDNVVCGWQLEPTGAVTIEIMTGATATHEAPVWAYFQTLAVVSGLGDEAHWDGHTLLVKVGTGFASFLVGGDSVKDLLAGSTNLARLVVPKLGH